MTERRSGVTENGGYEVPYPRLGSRFDEAEISLLTSLLTSTEGLSQGPLRDRFEADFRDYVGSAHAFSMTSGTVALRLAIQLLGLAPGDEVIVTPQTYNATIQPLLELDVRVRFCDIDPNTLNIDVDVLRTLISPRTRAVILVHYGGLPADMDEIVRLSREHGFLVVEDAAHALGAEYRGRRPGSLGDIGCFSFHSTKNITTLGEGGMITFDRDDWAERVLRWRGNQCDGVYRSLPPSATPIPPVPQALYPELSYTHECVEVRYAGTNATMSEPAAGVGRLQLRRLPELTARRRSNAGQLDQTLAALPGARIQRAPHDVLHAYHLYTFFVDPESGVDRDRVVARLRELGVEVWLRYFPLHLLPEWRRLGHGLGECPVAERLWFGQQINLPCQPWLGETQIKKMRVALEETFSEVTA
ncbi:DegT/DnrJ/EryC1/StrS family aminotransferase [Actinomadura viridis]|uniref:DegT/DnrJ/EryC1/StrS family aminotransferase n=1 Tax=Actinomadura viridis TaxID=58110 RepID=UPI0036AFC304